MASPKSITRVLTGKPYEDSATDRVKIAMCRWRDTGVSIHRQWTLEIVRNPRSRGFKGIFSPLILQGDPGSDALISDFSLSVN